MTSPKEDEIFILNLKFDELKLLPIPAPRPGDSPLTRRCFGRGKAAARVVAFSQAAHQAELNALANNAKPDVFALYAKDLEELVRLHCVNDAWKPLSGAFGDPTQFDSKVDSISKVQRRPSSNGVYFTERDLEFSIDDELKTLQVHVFWRFRPNWVTSGTGLTIPFPLEQINLDAASRSLKQQIAAFPGRPPIDYAT